MPDAVAEGSGAPPPPPVAPLDYRSMRRTFQRVRFVAALALLTIAVVGFVTDEPAKWLRLAAFGGFAVDAAIRSRLGTSILPSIVVDLIVGAVALGASDHPEAPLAVLLTYAVIVTIMFAGTRHLLWILGSAFGLMAVRMTYLQPLFEASDSSEVALLLGWFDTMIVVLAIATLMMTGASRLHEAREHQVAALQSERRASEMKNEFVSMVSHELRTPLTNIAGFALAVQESWRDLDGTEVDEFLGIICGEAEHLQNLVDDVLTIPRLEAGRLLLEPVDFELRPAAFRIADLLFPPGGEKEATVQVGGAVVVHADPNRVEQVLRNLFENARKYGGDHVTAEAHRSGEFYRIVIADNGPGVPPEFRETIFDRFEQVSRGDSRSSTGIGLGLTITRRLIEAMGGTIWYETGFPVGARFCFTLPAGVGARTESTESSTVSR